MSLRSCQFPDCCCAGPDEYGTEAMTMNHRYHNYDDVDVQRQRAEHIRSTHRILSNRGKRAPLVVRLYRAIMALTRRTR